MSEQIDLTVDHILNIFGSKVNSGIILGSGLGGFVDKIKVHHKVPYKDIPGFPVSTVKGHGGNLLLGEVSNKIVIVMQGRFHYYEGYSISDVVFPVRVMRRLGISKLILSNASGGVNPDYEVGDLMFLDDHINLMGVNPLTGANDESIGPRFPDMSGPYDHKMNMAAMEHANSNNIRAHLGVYAGVNGPCYETRAEYKYIRTIGADAVGMSTVPEVIAAKHMNMRCFAVSVITDLGGMVQLERLTHEEVVRVAGEAESKVSDIVLNLLDY